jgi:hypothetical protein
MALCLTASADMTAKMEVPVPGSLDCIAEGYFI